MKAELTAPEVLVTESVETKDLSSFHKGLVLKGADLFFIVRRGDQKLDGRKRACPSDCIVAEGQIGAGAAFSLLTLNAAMGSTNRRTAAAITEYRRIVLLLWH